MLNVSAVAATMFLGGWHAPFPFSHWAPVNDGWWGMFWLIFKIWVLMFLLIWTRGTLLRFRYDQFMNLGWKGLIPIALVWIVLVSVLQGTRAWVSDSTITLISVMVGLIILISVIVYFVTAPTEQFSEVEEEEDLDARFDAFAGGYPAPPLEGQTLPPSPRAGRAKVAVASVGSESVEVIEAVPSDEAETKEGSNE